MNVPVTAFEQQLRARTALLRLPLVTPSEPATSDSEDLLQQRARLAKAQAEQVELRNAIARREYAPVALLEEALAKSARQMAAVLERLPVELRRRNANLSAEDIGLVEQEIAKLRNIAADAALEWMDEPSEGPS